VFVAHVPELVSRTAQEALVKDIKPDQKQVGLVMNSALALPLLVIGYMLHQHHSMIVDNASRKSDDIRSCIVAAVEN
jgi:hypothetical protein